MNIAPNLCKVLVADDSRLVTSSITLILRQAGFKDIICAFTPMEVVSLCKQTHYDLIICDYNFQTQFNGFQILEELRHHKTLPAKTAFIFLTGENDMRIVRSIIDSEPDDYLLKPFSQVFFRARVLSVIRRRSALLQIFEKLHAVDYEGVVHACDELQPLHPEYSKLIRKYRAHALVQNKQFTKARDEYELLLKEDNFDWIKTALANTLIESNDLGQAQQLLETLQSKKDNPFYHDEMAKLAVLNEDLPKAIEHLKESTMLLDAGAERELVIANLSLAESSFEDAVIYIKRYYEKNRNTFRGGVFTKLNYIRCFLYRELFNPSNSNFENILYGLNPMISEIEKVDHLKTQALLIKAHIALIKGNLKTAMSAVQQALKSNNLTHFYDQYHFCLLLEYCSFFKDVKALLPQTRESIGKTQHPSILRSQVHMFKNLEKNLYESHKKISALRQFLSTKKSISTSEVTSHFDRYFQLHDLLPNSTKICLAILKLASMRPLDYQGNYHIFNKLESCDYVVRSLYSDEELHQMNYDSMYQSAKNNIKLHSAN
ncbi:response regulator [Vibrio mytili]|uniref:response regulator n=1 Tax=Vibrio mytili TaxID=50718 RepID=UPI002F3F4112